MTKPSRPDRHGRPAWGPSPWRLAAALAVAALVVWWAWPASPDAPAPPPPVAAQAARVPLVLPAAPHASAPAPAAAPAAQVAQATALPAPRIPRLRDPDGDQTPDLADYVNEGERPTMADVINRLHQAGVRTGLGAFSPPGTRPPLFGLAVPDDFALPAGYVRHYQATDDGQRIEPILMFAPDAKILDAAGQPVVLPKDRVVPPELAPAGLPLRRIEVPAPTDPAAPGR